jgi:hypothetical protein
MNESRLEALERRLADLEAYIADWRARYGRHVECNSLEHAKLEVRTDSLEDRLKEYEMVRTAAFCGYFATHPEVRDDLSKLDDLLNTRPPDSKKPPSAP